MEQIKAYYYQKRKPILYILLGIFVFVAILLVFFSLRKTRITVTGSSENVRMNEVARFMIHIASSNEDKQAAIDKMSEDTKAAVDAIKEFGIPDEDIKTTNLNIYQDQVWDDVTRKSEPGDWRASNSIEIKLVDIENIDEFTTLITSLEAANVSGPNFSLDSELTDEAALINAAVEDAKNKAEAVAKANGRIIVKIESIIEHTGEFSPTPLLRAEGIGAGSGIPIEPGTSSVSKTVTVTFVAK